VSAFDVLTNHSEQNGLVTPDDMQRLPVIKRRLDYMRCCSQTEHTQAADTYNVPSSYKHKWND